MSLKKCCNRPCVSLKESVYQTLCEFNRMSINDLVSVSRNQCHFNGIICIFIQQLTVHSTGRKKHSYR